MEDVDQYYVKCQNLKAERSDFEKQSIDLKQEVRNYISKMFFASYSNCNGTVVVLMAFLQKPSIRNDTVQCIRRIIVMLSISQINRARELNTDLSTQRNELMSRKEELEKECGELTEVF